MQQVNHQYCFAVMLYKQYKKKVKTCRCMNYCTLEDVSPRSIFTIPSLSKRGFNGSNDDTPDAL